MANIIKTYTFVNGQPADATQVNKDFDDVIDGVGDISAAGHALIDDADAAAQLETLGAVATGDARLSDARVASDVYPWAKASVSPVLTLQNRGTVSDFNAALTNGEYYVGSGSTLPNAPYIGGIFAKLRVYVSDGGTHDNVGNWIWQYLDDTGGNCYYRHKTNSGGWYAWQQITTNAIANTDSRLSNARPASDVYAWAKAAGKPSYSYAEVGAVANGDARLSNARPASDVYAWAKAPSKPSYTAAEVGATPINIRTGRAVVLYFQTCTVYHGLGSTPSYVGITQISGSVYATFFVTALTPSSFNVSASANSNFDVMWIAVA